MPNNLNMSYTVISKFTINADSLIMNISSRNSTCPSCAAKPSPLFLAVYLALLLNASWLMRPDSVTERASVDRRLGSLDTVVFAAKLSVVRNLPA